MTDLNQQVTAAKAWVAAIGAAITAGAVAASTAFPDSDETKTWVAIIVGVVGVATTFAATFQVPNQPKV
jgi:fluoride ion exporter CrcB/FEX